MISLWLYYGVLFASSWYHKFFWLTSELFLCIPFCPLYINVDSLDVKPGFQGEAMLP